jgi:hypothetical protein
MTLRRKSRILFETTVLTPVAPSWTSRPIIVGGATEGVEAAFTSGTFTGTAPVTTSYRYQIDGVDVGSIDTPYTPITGDVGKLLTVTQTATNAVGSAERISAGVVVGSAVVGGSTVEITFEPESGITSYQVAWGAEPDAETGTQTFTSVTGSPASVTVTGLTAGTIYFKVRSMPGGDWYSLGPKVIA